MGKQTLKKKFQSCIVAYMSNVTVIFVVVAAAVLLCYLYTRIIRRRFTRETEQKLERQRIQLENTHLENQLKLKRELIARLMHDMRSPINALTGYAALLKKSPEDLDLGKTASVIQRLSGSMKRVIDDMMNRPQPETAEMTLNKTKIQLSSIVKKIVELLRPLMKSRGIRVEYLFKKREIPGEILADREKIEQVINNLISNAIYFSPDRGTVKIDIKWVSKEGKYFQELSVMDDGAGIPEYKRQYLFEKVIPGEKKEVHQGTGLGLAISCLIIESHGGIIDYSPAPGGGSIFYFDIPEK